MNEKHKGPMDKKSTPSFGQPMKYPRKTTEYGRQLDEKQKVKKCMVCASVSLSVFLRMQ